MVGFKGTKISDTNLIKKNLIRTLSPSGHSEHVSVDNLVGGTATLLAENKYTLTANNSAILTDQTAAVTFEAYQDTLNQGSISTFDGTNLVITAGTRDIEVIALIKTGGSGAVNRIMYLRDVRDTLNTKYGEGVDDTGVSSRGRYGQSGDASSAHAVLQAGSVVTLNLVHQPSANSQVLRKGSYILVKEL